MFDNNENNLNNSSTPNFQNQPYTQNDIPIETLEPLSPNQTSSITQNIVPSSTTSPFIPSPEEQNNLSLAPPSISALSSSSPQPPSKKAFFTTSNLENNPLQEKKSHSISNIVLTRSFQTNRQSKPKKSHPFQIISITIVIFLLGGFMLSALIFHLRFFHISGSSMTPTIATSSWVLSSSAEEYTYGDIIAFYHNNVIMIKRVVGLPGDTIDIDESGNVYVNGNMLSEPYLTSKDRGMPEIHLPYTIHPDHYFVLGDNRADSIDSRTIAISGVKSTDIVGKVTYSIIPYKKLS